MIMITVQLLDRIYICFVFRLLRLHFRFFSFYQKKLIRFPWIFSSLTSQVWSRVTSFCQWTAKIDLIVHKNFNFIILYLYIAKIFVIRISYCATIIISSVVFNRISWLWVLEGKGNSSPFLFFCASLSVCVSFSTSGHLTKRKRRRRRSTEREKEKEIFLSLSLFSLSLSLVLYILIHHHFLDDHACLLHPFTRSILSWIQWNSWTWNNN